MQSDIYKHKNSIHKSSSERFESVNMDAILKLIKRENKRTVREIADEERKIKGLNTPRRIKHTSSQ